MFPYRDENETQRAAIVTGTIIALNVLTWLVVQGGGATIPLARSVCELGLIPGALTALLPPGTRFPLGEGLVCTIDPGGQFSHIFTSMFLHGSWLHLLGNMWFLWLFGNNIEDSMGRRRFTIFYLVCGLAAAAGQVLTNPDSAIPMVGASGAISGVMGGYLILSQRPGLHAGSHRIFHHLHRVAGMGDARLLAAHPICKRAAVKWRRGRSGVLGPCQWLRAWYGAD